MTAGIPSLFLCACGTVPVSQGTKTLPSSVRHGSTGKALLRGWAQAHISTFLPTFYIQVLPSQVAWHLSCDEGKMHNTLVCWTELSITHTHTSSHIHTNAHTQYSHKHGASGQTGTDKACQGSHSLCPVAMGLAQSKKERKMGAICMWGNPRA